MKPLNTIKKSLKLNHLLAIMVFALALAQIIFSNSFTTSGYDLNSTEKEIKEIEEENQQLKIQIASFGSMELLKGKAKEMKFVDTSNIVSLSVQKEVALNR